MVQRKVKAPAICKSVVKLNACLQAVQLAVINFLLLILKIIF